MKILRSLSHNFSHWNRKRKLQFVSDLIKARNVQKCLLVGAKAEIRLGNLDNVVEAGIRNLVSEVVASGLEPESHSWGNWIQADGKNLPFPDKFFDLVFSNAVIEHVGDENDQRKFINEQLRVGKNWVITTPNRLFPIESHTQKIFIHMSKRWTNPVVSRLLSKKDLKEMLPEDAIILGNVFSPTFICFNKQI